MQLSSNFYARFIESIIAVKLIKKLFLYFSVVDQDDKSVTLCLQVVPEADTFKESRFHISRNNIRPGWFTERSESTEDNESECA